uniref:23S rRNA (Pseudouridine(1915)-N(3))-methyltransferase RlmH n=1 Tax=Phenylobacterium glaciei TaxID=2803784 RepID=A0A974P4Q8_9CAUL|nr:23S rRNA (pseudouridine(1915)-N(3))-methyltransferase RlmH [Phenylobacterium glaciei]
MKLYVDRATAAGRALGLGPVEVVEVEAKKPGKAAEADVLRPHLTDAHVIACDERAPRASRDFAAEIARLRDQGAAAGVLDRRRRWPRSALVASANGKLAFGPQTWPHALARAMLAEQVYRAVTILAGGPYHRD